MIKSGKERAFLGAKGLLHGDSPNSQPGTSALQQALERKRIKSGQKLADRAKGVNGPGLDSAYSPQTLLPPN